MKINNAFDFGQIVYLKTDKDQLPRMVLRIIIHYTGHLLYDLGSSTATSWHYEFEISDEKCVLTSIT